MTAALSTSPTETVEPNDPPMLSARQLVQSMPEPFRAAVLAELLSAPADRAFLSLAPEMRTALMRPYLELDWDDTLTDDELAALTHPVAGR